MRYLFMVIAVCLPTWGAADVLKADKCYLCEAETAFGWPKDAEFTNPEVWVSRTKYVIEPAPQQREQYQLNGPIKDVEVTHTVKELGKDRTLFCTTPAEDVAFCYFGKDVLFYRHSFALRYNDNANLNFYFDDVPWRAFRTMKRARVPYEQIVFQSGICLSF
ncbi:MAG: hypothetical protein JJ897_17440 [Marinibacterium sp.]|nr:hypothetical protein [Marinibacterium sp.]